MRYFTLIISTATSVLAYKIYAVVTVLISLLLWGIWIYRRRRRAVSARLLSTENTDTSLPRPSWFDSYIIVIQGVLALLFFIDVYAFIVLPSANIVFPELPVFEPMPVTNIKPLTVKFDRPISNTLTKSIQPEVAGKWIQKNTKIPFATDTLTFIPAESLLPDTEYLVEFTSSHEDSSAKTQDGYLFLFRTPPLSDITSSSPANNEENVSVDNDIHITLSGSQADTIEWSATIDPPVEINTFLSQDKSMLIIDPVQDLLHSTMYTVTVSQTPIIINYETKEIVQKLDPIQESSFSFTTAESADIADISPSGTSVLPTLPLIIQFRQSMDTQSVTQALTISPDIDHETSWITDRQLNITPAAGWNTDTLYRITIDDKAKTKLGGKLTTEYVHEFHTLGAVSVESKTPSDEETDVSITSDIRVTFNQQVDESATSLLSFSPAIEGEFTWNDNTLIFDPVALQYNTRYVATLKRGASSAYGDSMSSDIQWTFMTAPENFVLSVPFYKQSQSFTCFSASSKMALGYYGIDIDEISFLDKIGKDMTVRNFVTNSWGDPNKGIVGSIDGSGSGGYGAHWGPVASAIEKYRPVEIKRGWNIQELLQEVRSGNPVMIWWVNGIWPARDVSWYTPSGEKVYTVNGMHVNVVKGWVGDIANPQYIITNDSARGERYIPPDQFLSLWRWFDNTAVIVR